MKIIQQSERSYAGPRLVRISHWFWAATFLFCFVPVLRAQSSLTKDESGSSSISVAGSPDNDAYGGSTQRDQSDSDAPAVTAKSTADHNDRDNWVTKWLSTVDKARSEQPHYVAPLVPTHVLLVQQYRYDSSWQTNSDGIHTDNYGNGRGREIIPNTRMEVQIAHPPYIVHSGNIANGNGDTSLFVKFRAFSAPFLKPTEASIWAGRSFSITPSIQDQGKNLYWSVKRRRANGETRQPWLAAELRF